MVLALISGIAAMHTGIDTPMTATSTADFAHSDLTSMASSLAGPTPQHPSVAADVARTSTTALGCVDKRLLVFVRRGWVLCRVM